MKVKNGLVRHEVGLEVLRRGEVIHSWKFSKHCAGANYERIKISREDSVYIAVLHQQSNPNVCPVDVGSIHLLSDKRVSFSDTELGHTKGI